MQAEPGKTPDTRDTLLRVAMRQFAEKGFAGTSIAAIASELGLTKQALLHHFGRKEALYRQVLENVSQAFEDSVAGEIRAESFPYRFALFAESHPLEMQLIVRELLDNEARAESARTWVMRDFLVRLVRLVRAARPDLSEVEARVAVWAFIGAVSYFAVSHPTQRRIYGDAEAQDMAAAMPDIMRGIADRVFGS